MYLEMGHARRELGEDDEKGTREVVVVVQKSVFHS